MCCRVQAEKDASKIVQKGKHDSPPRRLLESLES